MKAPRVTALALFVVAVCAGEAHGQAPGVVLGAAINQLFQAGNYSWRESRQDTFNGRATVRPYGFGRTVIDGFTLATIIQPHNQRAAFYGPRTAFQIKEGWRRVEDLTDLEIVEVYGGRLENLTPTNAKYRRQYSHALVHDCLRLLVDTADNLREEDGMIVGEVPSVELEMFLSSGRPPRALPTRSILGVPLPTRARKRPGQTSLFRASLVDGKLAKIVFDFSAAGVVARGEHAGKEFAMQQVYVFDVMDIGKTQVDIGPEIMGVFNDVPARR